MNNEIMRKEFEAAACANTGHRMLLDFSRRHDGEYNSACERAAWWAWQASREALTVTIEPGDCFSPNDCGDLAIWRDDVKRLLEAAGIKVK